MTISEEALAKLSPEERDALADEEQAEDPKAAAAAAEATADDADETNEADEADEAAEPEAAEPAAAEPAEPAEPVAAAAEDDDGVFAPNYRYQLVEGIEDKLKAFTDQLAELRQKHKDGEIGFDEYDEQKDALLEERTKLQTQHERAVDERETFKLTVEQEWQRDSRRFIRTHKEYADDVLFGALDAQITKIANDPATSTKSNAWILNQAHERVMKAFGRTPAPAPAPAPLPASSREAVKQAVDARKPKAAVPRTLADVPAADKAETSGDDGEFAHLDNLTGMDLERELARMPKDQQDRYLRA